MKPWWKHWPGRLKAELRAIRNLGVEVKHDKLALRAGVVRLLGSHIVDGRKVDVAINYPDLYPFFRCEIEAPGEDLPYHQHPQSKFLCVLGRATDNWHSSMTAADILRDRVPLVFAAAAAPNAAAAAELEQHQAEPYGSYYPYGNSPATITVQGDWKIDSEAKSGLLSIGVLPHHPSQDGAFFRGCVLEVLDNARHRLAAADQSIRDAFASSPRISARWVRIDKPLATFDPKAFLETIRANDPGASNNPEHPFNGNRLRIWGVLFPENVIDGADWRATGEGWTFICQVARQMPMASGRIQRPRR